LKIAKLPDLLSNFGSLTRSTAVPGDLVIVNDQDRLARHPNR
jgi:hypothetical protein